MKDKRSQFQKQLRQQHREQYFSQRRTEMLQFYSKSCPNHRSSSSQSRRSHFSPSFATCGFNCSPVCQLERMDEELPQQQEKFVFQGEEIRIHVTCNEEGEYYLNWLTQSFHQRYLEETVAAMGRVLSGLLRLQIFNSRYQEDLRTKLVYMALKKMHNLLTDQQPTNSLKNRSSRSARKLLSGLLEEDYQLLLKSSDSIIVSLIIDIAFELSVRYVLLPNYHLIKYILIRIITKDNLLDGLVSSSASEEISQKIETLLIRFIVCFRFEESSNGKLKGVHHQQVIYEYYNLIEFNLANIFEFTKNREYPFDYQHVNTSIAFFLTLLMQIMKKFKPMLVSRYEDLNSPLILIRPAIVDLLFSLAVVHQRSMNEGNFKDYFTELTEELCTTMMNYLREIKTKHDSRRQIYSRTCIFSNEMKNNEIMLPDLLLLIKVKTRQLQELLD